MVQHIVQTVNKGGCLLQGDSSRAGFLLYPVDVLPRDGVPCGHVFLHALSVAGGFSR